MSNKASYFTAWRSVCDYNHMLSEAAHYLHAKNMLLNLEKWRRRIAVSKSHTSLHDRLAKVVRVWVFKLCFEALQCYWVLLISGRGLRRRTANRGYREMIVAWADVSHRVVKLLKKSALHLLYMINLVAS